MGRCIDCGTKRLGVVVRAQVTLIHPGARHADSLFDLLNAVGTGGNLTTDAHLVALAIEHQVELHSTDADMALTCWVIFGPADA